MREQMTTSPSTVRLFELEPDLACFLSGDERERLSGLEVPARVFERGEVPIEEVLRATGAFAAVVLDRVLLHRVMVGEQSALKLLGPGDMLTISGSLGAGLVHQSGYRATGPTRIAFLDDQVLLANRRFPGLCNGMIMRLSEQHDRLMSQMAICQLPRVEDRVLGILWLLAESWGKVTSAGTRLPLALTHDALGELIGARRPTVSLALSELADRGAVVRQAGGWLLLERPVPPNSVQPALRHGPELVPARESLWRAPTPIEKPERRREATAPGRPAPASIFESVRALRMEHARKLKEFPSRLEVAAASRERSRAIRALIQERRLRERAPSSR